MIKKEKLFILELLHPRPDNEKLKLFYWCIVYLVHDNSKELRCDSNALCSEEHFFLSILHKSSIISRFSHMPRSFGLFFMLDDT